MVVTYYHHTILVVDRKKHRKRAGPYSYDERARKPQSSSSAPARKRHTSRLLRSDVRTSVDRKRKRTKKRNPRSTSCRIISYKLCFGCLGEKQYRVSAVYLDFIRGQKITSTNNASMAGQYPVFVVKREGDATKRLRDFFRCAANSGRAVFEWALGQISLLIILVPEINAFVQSCSKQTTSCHVIKFLIKLGILFDTNMSWASPSSQMGEGRELSCLGVFRHVSLLPRMITWTSCRRGQISTVAVERRYLFSCCQEWSLANIKTDQDE